MIVCRPTMFLLILAMGTAVLSCHTGIYAQPSVEYRLVAEDRGRAEERKLEAALLLDPSGVVELTDLIEGEIDPFSAPEVGDNKLRDYYCWTRIEVVNTTKLPKAELMGVNRSADSIWLYQVIERELVGVQTSHKGGGVGGPYLTLRPSVFELNVPGRTRMTVYVRAYYHQPWEERALAAVYFRPTHAVMRDKMRQIGWHSLYIGTMLTIAVLGILSYRLFREPGFLYFALVTLSFAAYFMDTNLLQQLVGLGAARGAGFGWMSITISACVISLTVFVVYYTDLRRYSSAYFTALLSTAVLAVLAQLIPNMMGWHVRTVILIANFSVLVWTVCCIALLIVLGRQGYQPARRLLLATMALGVPGVVYILQFVFIEARYYWLEMSFEIGTLGFTVLLFSGLYSQVTAIRSRAETLTQQNELKSRLFANLSHEFRTPLTLIMGPVEQLLQRFPAGEEAHELLTIVHANAERQLTLINRVLELSRLEADQERLEAQLLDLNKLLEQVVEAFAPLATQRGILLDLVSKGGSVYAMADRIKIEDIVYNLLSNAFKFTPTGGKVTIGLTQEDGQAKVSVTDTGEGIEKERLTNIFDRFFQGDSGRRNDTVGSGIGLSLVRELVRLHGGRVYAESEVGEGTTFTFTLPTTLESHSGQVTATREYGGATIEEPNIPQLNEKSAEVNGPTVLVVEDNVALRQFIHFTLRQEYRVAEAADGDEGYALAGKLQPDLIISDVMMPGRDGYALCMAIKSNLETSHIPVILLTARASTPARVEGLQTGADDYLTKPFNSQELLARIRNLIESRRVLRQHYAESISLRPAEVATTPVDAEFLKLAVSTVEQYMDDDKFKVADFARAMQLSPTSLNRKLRALLDQSSNQFIQSVRLQRAADLLDTKNYTVAEVALATGFSSSAYFIKLFRERFGDTPGSRLRNEEV